MQKPKTVIFDFDGVIADSAPFYCERYRTTANAFGKAFPVNNMEEFREWYDSSFENNYINLGFTKEELEKARKGVRVVDSYSHINIFPGIKEAIINLYQNYNIAIASCTSGKVITNKLIEEGLDDYITFLSPGDKYGSYKKEIIGRVLSELQIEPDSAVMIGDTEMDILCAAENGITPIGSAYGWHPRNKLEKAGCKYIAEKPEDIPELVVKIFTENRI